MTAIETKTLKVGRYVDTAHVDTVIREYKKERWIYNTERLGKEDSMSVWYSVEELEEFLQRIKDHGGDGIRLYFAAYPQNYETKPEYAGRQTIVFVGTKNKEIEGGSVIKDMYINGDNGVNVLAYNSGGICPPGYCPGTKRPGSGDPDPDWGGLGVTIIDSGAKGLRIA